MLHHTQLRETEECRHIPFDVFINAYECLQEIHLDNLVLIDERLLLSQSGFVDVKIFDMWAILRPLRVPESRVLICKRQSQGTQRRLQEGL